MTLLIGRRTFILAPFVVASSLPRTLVAAGNLTDTQRILVASARAGIQNNPSVQMLTRQGAEFVARLSDPREVDQATRSIANLGNLLTRSSSLNGVIQGTTSEFSQRIGLDSAMHRAISEGKIVAGRFGVLPTYIPARPSVLEESTRGVASLIRQYTGDASSRILGAVDAALGQFNTAPATIDTLLSIVGPVGGAQVRQLWQAASTDIVELQGLKNLAQTLQTRAENYVKEVGGQFKVIVDQVKNEASSLPKIAESLFGGAKELLAGANTLNALLSLLGPSTQEIQTFVTKVSGYVQSASQVVQSVAMIAATGGWGAIAALPGLMNGAAGLAVFGGQAGDVLAQRRHEEVMEGIRQLRQVIVTEFRRVNFKLDYLIEQMDRILQLTIQQGMQIDLLLTDLGEVNRKITAASVQTGLGFFDIIEKTANRELAECEGLATERTLDKVPLNRCATRFANTAVEATQPPWLVRIDSAQQAHALLKTIFYTTYDVSKVQLDSLEPYEAWSAARALNFIYESEYRYTPRGKPAFEPALLRSAEGYIRLQAQFPAQVKDLDEARTKSQVGQLYDSLKAHTAYTQSVTSFHPVHMLVSEHQKFQWKLTDLHRARGREFLRERIETEFKREANRGTRRGPRKDDIIRSRTIHLEHYSNGQRVSHLPVFEASDFGLEPKKIHPVFLSCPPGCIVESGKKHEHTVSLRISGLSISSLSQEGSFAYIHFNVVLMLYHGDIPLHSVGFRLVERRFGNQILEFKPIEESIRALSPFEYLRQATQRTGADADKALIGWIKDGSDKAPWALVDSLLWDATVNAAFNTLYDKVYAVKTSDAFRELTALVISDAATARNNVGDTTVSKDYNKESTRLWECVAQMGRSALVIRAACHFGARSYFAQSQDFQSLFHGNLFQKLPDEDVVTAWARYAASLRHDGTSLAISGIQPVPALAPLSEEDKRYLVPLAETMKARVQQLENAWEVFGLARSDWGPPLQLAYVQSRLQAAFAPQLR